MLVLLGIAFLAGVITAISPCVLPVLPIVLAGGAASSDRRRPFTIVAGLVLSFTAFTLGGTALVSALGLPADVLRNLAIATLLLVAATLLSRRLAFLVGRPFLFLTRRRVTGDGGGLVLGLSLGLVFVPCAGPVLAAVTVLAATGGVGIRTVLVTGAYGLGAGLPMLAIAIGGQRLSSGVRLLKAHAETTRRVAGLLLGLTAIAIALGVDSRFTTALPGYTQALQRHVEESRTARKHLADLSGESVASAATAGSSVPAAPEFRDVSLWLNTEHGRPPSIAGLRGRVVLVDFWTYSCINCLRTLPHLKAWDAAYRRAGLTIVGVHTPEFAFERVPSNVRSAVHRLGVRYPVALDNGYGTWRAYGNNYWPADYLVDRTGHVRFTHFGEGAYGETEDQIRQLLGERVHAPRTQVADTTPDEITTPESYLGFARLTRFAGGQVAFDTQAAYRFPARLGQDELAYGGRWTVEPSRIVAGDGARLRLRFQARNVFLVLGGTGHVRVVVDGRPRRTILVSGTPRLHTIERFGQLERGVLELRFSPGISAYAFTFG